MYSSSTSTGAQKKSSLMFLNCTKADQRLRNLVHTSKCQASMYVGVNVYEQTNLNFKSITKEINTLQSEINFDGMANSIF